MSSIFGHFGQYESNRVRKMASLLDRKYIDEVKYYQNKVVMLGQGISRIGADYCPRVLTNEDGTIALVVDGRIFNIAQLRTLLRKNHSFSTDFSGEIILHLYEEHGLDFIKDLHGEFSFCLYDARDHSLILCTDSAASRPLHYSIRADGLLFSSNAFPLYSYLRKRELNEEALKLFFTYLIAPGPQTLMRGVLRMLPAQYLLFKDGKAIIKRYHEARESVQQRDEGFFIKKTRTLLEQSVRNRCQRDVPIHATLGGLDSGCIVGILSKQGYKVNTYSISSKGAESELETAAEIANMHETNHKEIFLDQKDILRYYAQILPRMNVLSVLDAGALILSSTFSRIRDRRFLLFNGEGAGGVFGGVKNEYMLFCYRFNRFPKPMKIGLNKLIYDTNRAIHCWNYFHQKYRIMGNPVPEFKYYINLRDLSQIFCDLTPSFHDNDFFQEKLSSQPLHIYDSYLHDVRFDILNRLMKLNLELRTYLETIPRSESLCNIHGANNASPFIDKLLVDFSYTIPIHYKYKRTANKVLLTNATKDLFKRPIPKFHYNLPLFSLLYGHIAEQKHLLNEFVDRSRAFALMKKNPVEVLVRQGKRGGYRQKWKVLTQLHAIYSLGIWYEHHFSD